jgi:hypothetical protein
MISTNSSIEKELDDKTSKAIRDRSGQEAHQALHQKVNLQQLTDLMRREIRVV